MINKFFVTADKVSTCRVLYCKSKVNCPSVRREIFTWKITIFYPITHENRSHAFSRKRDGGEIQVLGHILWTTTTTTWDGNFAFIGACRSLSMLYVCDCLQFTKLAVAFISNNFPLVYPAKESQDVGFVKYSAEK